jgi:hypothetical protein
MGRKFIDRISNRFFSIYNHKVATCTVDIFSFVFATNVLWLCEGGELEVQMFILAQIFIRIPFFKFSTNAPLLQNPF